MTVSDARAMARLLSAGGGVAGIGLAVGASDVAAALMVGDGSNHGSDNAAGGVARANEDDGSGLAAAKDGGGL